MTRPALVTMRYELERPAESQTPGATGSASVCDAGRISDAGGRLRISSDGMSEARYAVTPRRAAGPSLRLRAGDVQPRVGDRGIEIGEQMILMGELVERSHGLEEPKIPATKPATIAVIRPAVAPSPIVIPNASASGNATTLTVTPATTSPRQELLSPA